MYRSFDSTIPVNDTVRVKSYGDLFIDPSSLPVRVSINNLYLVLKWVMAGLMGLLVFWFSWSVDWRKLERGNGSKT